MGDIGFLALGYGFIWLILGFYLFTLARRHSALQKEADRLEKEMSGRS